jgi:hypothetical protein
MAPLPVPVVATATNRASGEPLPTGTDCPTVTLRQPLTGTPVEVSLQVDPSPLVIVFPFVPTATNLDAPYVTDCHPADGVNLATQVIPSVLVMARSDVNSEVLTATAAQADPEYVTPYQELFAGLAAFVQLTPSELYMIALAATATNLSPP